MEKEIGRVVARLRWGFAAVWMVAALTVAAGETDLLPAGLLADDVRATYVCETIVILLTATGVPVSMKMFSLVLTKRVNEESLPAALAHYRLWSDVRLGVLLAVVLAGLTCYYLTMSKSGGLCALIGLVATLFCIPGEERLRRELNIYRETEEDEC
jgi:hypothetical protein